MKDACLALNVVSFWL